ncbi:YqcI/YcgG family protein [Paenibacillus sp. SN-8-1]|uniref:YqcI/YcgG family protein n=1 Tax=Paenibacillus sp. SN-8-1 TaxID=3435409 RepID=UPI003D9A8639
MILYDNQMMEGHSVPPEDWQVAAYHAFAAKMTNKEDKFPCIPATLGFTHSHLRYGFVPDPRSPYAEQTMADLLRNYTERSRHFGKYTSLILFFDTPGDLRNKWSVEQYEALFWDLLSRTVREDKREWPQHIPVDPSDHVWEFCFHEESYFVYCATPAHTRRQSRYFPFFMLALTPRWVLVEFNKLPKQTQMIKPLIRQRLKTYDTIGPHPDLKLYGDADNYEWKQYFLRDNDTTAPSCPFIHGRLSKTRDHSSTN